MRTDRGASHCRAQAGESPEPVRATPATADDGVQGACRKSEQPAAHPEQLPDWWRPPTPYQPGNLESVRHGAFSSRLVAAKVAELEPDFQESLEEHSPWAARPEYELIRRNTLQSTAVVEMLFTDIVETAARDGVAKVPTRRFETLLAALNGQRKAYEALGLTPPSRAALAQTASAAKINEASLADLAAEGRKTRAMTGRSSEATIAGETATEPPREL